MPKTSKDIIKEKEQKEKIDKIADLLGKLFKKEDDFFLKNKKEKQ